MPARHGFHGLYRNNLDPFAHSFGMLSREVLDQKWNVLWPITQRRYRNWEYLKTIVQIATELASLDHLF